MTEPKCRPVIFNGEMVRALLADRKTQTRRVMKPQPEVGGPLLPCIVCGKPLTPAGRSAPMEMRACDHGAATTDLWPDESRGDFGYPTGWEGLSPYGKPGDLLWVREAWSPVVFYEEDTPENCTPELARQEMEFSDDPDTFSRDDGCGACIVYRAECDDLDDFREAGLRWKPSIHMPRWASRITLEVTAVRVERVQDISEEDAGAEGVIVPECERCGYTYYDCQLHMDHSRCKANGSPGSGLPLFTKLWDSINARRGFGWDANPWVWVVEFKRVAA